MKNRLALYFFLVAIFVCNCASSQCDEAYQVLWGLNNRNAINVKDAILSAQDNLIVCGTSASKGTVIYFEKTSSVRWAKTFAFGSSVLFSKVIAMSDGGLTLAGYVTENNKTSLLIVRLNSSGSILWTKVLHDISSVSGLTNQHLLIESLAETPDGGIVICGRKNYKRNSDGQFNNRIFIFKMSTGGEFQWTREDTQGNEDEAFGMLVDQGSIVIVGTTYSVTNGIRYGFLEKLDPVDGAVQSLNFYQLGTSESNFFRSIKKGASGYQIGTQAFMPGLKIYNALRTDFSGTPIESKMLPNIELNLLDHFYHPVPLADGSTIVWKDWLYSATDVQLAKFNSVGKADWNFEYTAAGKQSLATVLPYSDGTALAVGSSPDPQYPNGSEQIYLLKVKPNGTLEDCVSNPLNFTIKDSLIYKVNKGLWQTTRLNFQAPYTLSLNIQDVTLNQIKVCKNMVCQIDDFSITGERVICKPGAILTYKAKIAGNCAMPVKWELENAIGSLKQINDTTVQIHFTRPGKAVLKANVNLSCTDYNTEVTLDYNPVSYSVNLGMDTSICKGDTLTLSANGSFSFLQWMNGTTEKQIKVSSTGNYSVTVSNDGVCYMKDTIQVLVHPATLLQLPKDTLLCTPDNQTLHAGTGFQHYLWQDGSSKSTFVVQHPGTYWVHVTDKNGCSASDTVSIKKISASPVNFTTTSQAQSCYGEKVTLKAQGNFADYIWRNGESLTSTHIVERPGIYSVEVRTVDGCIGRDTVVIKDRGCIDALYIPTAFSPNHDGKNDTFKAHAIGEIVFYHMKVYNRWGELVFQTNNLYKGWNGVYKNKMQSTDTFVWYVQYRFASNESLLSQKGVLSLIQ